MDNDFDGFVCCANRYRGNDCIDSIYYLCGARVSIILGNECEWNMHGPCGCSFHWLRIGNRWSRLL